MVTFSPGDIVEIARIPGTWVVAGADINGIPPNSRWFCLAHVSNGERLFVTRRTVGFGDLQMLKPAVTFQFDVKLEHDGETVMVMADHGDVVRCRLPRRRRPIGYRNVHVNLGEGESDLSKPGLVLENIRAVLRGDFDDA